MSSEYHRLKAENEDLLQKVPKTENELENLKQIESENFILKENLKQIQACVKNDVMPIRQVHLNFVFKFWKEEYVKKTVVISELENELTIR